MYYIGLDVHKKTISFSAKDAAGHVYQEGKIASTQRELDAWTPMHSSEIVISEVHCFPGSR
jgi:hypothetical protein